VGFHLHVIWKCVSPKFIEFPMEMLYWCTSEGPQDAGHKVTETSEGLVIFNFGK